MSRRRIHPLAPVALVAILVLYAAWTTLAPYWVMHAAAGLWFLIAATIAATGWFVSDSPPNVRWRARVVFGSLAGATVSAVALTHALQILGVAFKGSPEEMFMVIMSAATVLGLVMGTIIADVMTWATDRRRADPDHAEDVAGNPEPPSPLAHRE